VPPVQKHFDFFNVAIARKKFSESAVHKKSFIAKKFSATISLLIANSKLRKENLPRTYASRH